MTVILAVFLCTGPAFARENPPGTTSRVVARTGEEKHFDFDRDGFLDPYESLHLRTHRTLHYPLVTKLRQQPYDANGDGMLEPAERQLYLVDKETGRIKEVYAKFKADKKRREEARESRLDRIEEQNRYLEARRALTGR